jgi:hypothetical protein
MSSILCFYYSIMALIMLLIAIVISKFVHSQVNSKRFNISAVYLFVWYVLQHRTMRGILKNQRLQVIPIKKPKKEFL